MAPFDRHSFASRLRETIRQRRFTQKTLAKLIGVSTRSMTQYCTGQSLPGADTLSAISLALTISTDYLLRGDLPAEYDRNPSRIMDVIQLLPIKDRETLLTLTLILFRGSVPQRELLNTFVALDKLQVSQTFPRENAFRKTLPDRPLSPRRKPKHTTNDRTKNQQPVNETT